MLVLGVLLILLAVAAAIAVAVAEPAASTTVTVLGRDFTVTGTQMFVLGLITATLFLLGLALLWKGLRRSRVRRKELRYARLEGRERVARLEEEKRDLQRRLGDATPARGAPGDTTGGGSTAERAEPAEHGRATAPAPGSGHEEEARHKGFIDRLVSLGRR